MLNYSFHKGTELDIYKKAPFSRDQEQVSEGANTADSKEKREGDGEGERAIERERGGEEGGCRCPNPLNEIKAPYKTPLISTCGINLLQLFCSRGILKT